MIKSYSDLILLPTFEERFEYLKLNGRVAHETFGFDRYLNQVFYRSTRWKHIRDFVIVRDNGCDLGVEGYDISGRIILHHMNPVQEEDIRDETDLLIDPEYLICVSHLTHEAIHYSNLDLLPKGPAIREPFDTCPWRK